MQLHKVDTSDQEDLSILRISSAVALCVKRKSWMHILFRASVSRRWSQEGEKNGKREDEGVRGNALTRQPGASATFDVKNVKTLSLKLHLVQLPLMQFDVVTRYLHNHLSASSEASPIARADTDTKFRRCFTR